MSEWDDILKHPFAATICVYVSLAFIAIHTAAHRMRGRLRTVKSRAADPCECIRRV
jgi:hypothetical protein